MPFDLPLPLILPEKPAIVRASTLPSPAILRRWKQEETKRGTFMVTPLCGFMAGGTPDVVSTMTAHPTSATDASSYSFATQAIGTATADRIIAVGVSIQSLAVRTISTLSIAGNNAAVQSSIDAVTGGQTVLGAIYSLLVPTGTTATIVVTPSGACVRCAITVWALYNCASATAVNATNSAVVNSSSLGASLTTLPGGVALGYCCHTINGGGTLGNLTWTNLTEDVDETYESANVKQGAASLVEPGGATLTRTINFAATVPNRVALALSAFR